MTQPEIDEVDDTAPVADDAPPAADPAPVETPSSTDSPTAAPPAPPGDFTTGSVLSSPSTWVTAITYLLPILSAVFHKDFSQYAQAISELAPIIATAILLVARNLHKREVIRANAHLAVERLAHSEMAKRDAVQLAAGLQREATLALVAKLTPAEAKKILTSGDTIKLPVAA